MCICSYEGMDASRDSLGTVGRWLENCPLPPWLLRWGSNLARLAAWPQRQPGGAPCGCRGRPQYLALTGPPPRAALCSSHSGAVPRGPVLHDRAARRHRARALALFPSSPRPSKPCLSLRVRYCRDVRVTCNTLKHCSNKYNSHISVGEHPCQGSQVPRRGIWVSRASSGNRNIHSACEFCRGCRMDRFVGWARWTCHGGARFNTERLGK